MSEPQIASREQFLKGFQRRYMICPQPSNGLFVRIQNLTSKELEAFQALRYDEDGEVDADVLNAQHRHFLVRVLVDSDGRRMFSDNDVDLLADLDGGDIGFTNMVAREHCGMNRTLNDAKKNLNPTTAENSPSA